MVIWISGMPGTGKSTLANHYFKQNKKKIKNLIIIDGDDFRKTMNNDLGYTLKDREKCDKINQNSNIFQIKK